MTGREMPFRRHAVFVSAALTAAALLAPGPWRAAGADPRLASRYPDKEETWYVVMFGEAKCGYMHSMSDRIDDEVHTRLRMRFEIARGDARVEIAAEQAYRETLDGRPLGFSQEMRMGEMPIRHEGIISKGKVRLTTEQAGAKRAYSFDFDPDVKFTWGQLLEQRKRGLKKGQRFTLKTYEPSIRTDGPVEMEFQVQGKEKVNVLGREMELHRITSTMKLRPVGIPGGAAPGAAPQGGRGAGRRAEGGRRGRRSAGRGRGGERGAGGLDGELGG